jgi:hypothetical protein
MTNHTAPPTIEECREIYATYYFPHAAPAWLLAAARRLSQLTFTFEGGRWGWR